MLRRFGSKSRLLSEYQRCKRTECQYFASYLTYKNNNEKKTPKKYNVYKRRKFSTSSTTVEDVPLPSHSQIVIAGAGAVANSVAYHLVINGWKDVVVLEQNTIGSGTSHFGSGTLGLFKPIAHRNIISYSIQLYRQLQDMGYNVGWHQCGSVILAQSKDRMIALKRRLAYNVPTGLHCEILGKEELKRLHTYLHVDDLEGAVWVPEDAVVNPTAVCHVLAHLTKQGGGQYIENCFIDRVLTENGVVKKVITNKGNIECQYFVNCAGMWARDLGLRCSPPVKIPAYPAEHFYVMTSLSSLKLNPNLPCIRDMDSYSYVREWQGGVMAGWFEPEAKPAFVGTSIPTHNWKQYVKDDPSHWKPLWDKVVHRLPVLQECNELEVYNCPDNFTPDGRWILGESSEIKNYYIAVGMNGNSLQGAGGIGKAVAEWLMNGESTQELLPFNVQRFLDLHTNKQYLQQRVREVVGRNYSILYPHQCEYKYARQLRCSPLYSVLQERGAIFGIKMAYERALYFDSTYRRGLEKPQMPPGSFYKPKFLNFMKEEFQACREGVGIIDMSSFSKTEITSGRLEVVNYLQKLCSTDVNIPVGSIVRTGMHNERGGYENDCILVRQVENRYFMISPTLQQTRIHRWMSRHLPSDQSVGLHDVTSKYTVINIVGPKAASLLMELSNSDVNLSPFSYKSLNVGYASDVMLMAFTHTGEPGFCLYIPSEYAIHVYITLIEVGRDFGVRDVGVLTQRFMRLERFIPFWAEELTPYVTPFEAGSGHNINLDKGNFIGKAALQRQKEEGIKKRLVLFTINDFDQDKDVWAWGGEPLYRNGQFVGTVTSAGYGFFTKKLICLGFIGHSREDSFSAYNVITSDFIMDPSAHYEIDIAGRRFPIKPHLHPFPQPSERKKYIPTPIVTYESDVLSKVRN